MVVQRKKKFPGISLSINWLYFYKLCFTKIFSMYIFTLHKIYTWDIYDTLYIAIYKKQ